MFFFNFSMIKKVCKFKPEKKEDYMKGGTYNKEYFAINLH